MITFIVTICVLWYPPFFFSFYFRYDSLTLYDGDSKTSPVLAGKLCGDLTDINPEIVSTTNQVFLHFKTDDSDNYKGYEIEWIAVTGTC